MANLAVAIVAADTVTPQGLVTVDLGIDEDGRIAAVGRPGSVQAPERIDASGLVAIPGGVDSPCPRQHVLRRDDDP